MVDLELVLRPAQETILQYRRGRMAVSAVPGSGKTFTLSLLAAQLIASGRINVAEGQQVLIVTYLNAGVENFKAQVRRWLHLLELPLMGFDVRTLHSLGLEIVRIAQGSQDETNELLVLDEMQSGNLLRTALNGWVDDHPQLWHAFLPDDSLQMKARWREITERTARVYMRAAKNARYRPETIQQRLTQTDANAVAGDYALLWMLNGIYSRYRDILNRQAALDFDDLIWEGVDLIERRPDLARVLRTRWPYVLEDEAQDSVPLQESLLGALTGGSPGNWVRVGDPNQAITSTFTAAHPRFFNTFIDRPDVVAQALPNSGRCAPLIFGAANTLLHWVCDQHPLVEVRQQAFRRQDILPTPAGDPQPNPPDSQANMRIKVYKRREEEELPDIARLAHLYTQKYTHQTVAVLVPTNAIGYRLAEFLDDRDADYDNLLRGGTREREIAAALYGLLALLADPLSTRALVDAHEALLALAHPVAGNFIIPDENENDNGDQHPDLARFHALLRSVFRPELLLFPNQEEDILDALPAGVATTEDLRLLATFMAFMRRLFTLRTLPVDDLTLALADELFAYAAPLAGDPRFPEMHPPPPIRESDLAIAYQIAGILRHWRDLHPEWRLPELVAELADVASGRRSLPLLSPGEMGYEPQPGRISLTTQHSAKGLEWDAVFLVGIDGFWIPGDLEATFLGVHDFLGGDPTAEATAQLFHLMQGDAQLHPGRTATESAHIEVICERLRLLYVGITRARRYLHISRSRTTRQYQKSREAAPATVLGVLYQYMKEQAA
jgi:DNA helicase-2/ATP-dependent DNA helicase PcrA